MSFAADTERSRPTTAVLAAAARTRLSEGVSVEQKPRVSPGWALDTAASGVPRVRHHNPRPVPPPDDRQHRQHHPHRVQDEGFLRTLTALTRTLPT